MEKNEIVVYDSEGKIISTKFKRMDLSVPATILSYCDDVKNTITNILQSTAQMSMERQGAVLDEKLIANITGFEDSLDESEKKAKQKQLPVVVGIKSLLTKMGVEKFKKEEEMATYKGRYLDYCSKIQQVVEAVEAQKQASLDDIALRNRIAEEIKPLIEELEVMINVGKQDRDAYALELENLKNTEPKTLDLEYEVQYKTQILEVLNNKLTELEKALVLYKTQVQQYKVQQATEMQAVMSADSYIKDTAPILVAQGSVMVFNREQTTRLAALHNLNDASNVALTQNATELAENASSAVELSLNNGISIGTIEQLHASLETGMKVFQDGRQLKIEQVEQERRALEQLNTKLDEYQREVLQLIDDKEVMADVLGDKTPSAAKVRRLTTRK